MAFAARRSLASRGLSGHLARVASNPPFPTSSPPTSPAIPGSPRPSAPRPFHFALAPSETAQTLNHLPFGFHLARAASTPPSPTSSPPTPPAIPGSPHPSAPRQFHFVLAPSGTAQTINHLPFSLHLAGPPHRNFSSSSSCDLDFADNVLTDAAHCAAPAATAPASFPGEVAWAAEDSSLAVAAVQYLIDAVHSFTGLNWWLSIAISTALLRCVLLIMLTPARKQLYAMRQEVLQTTRLLVQITRLIGNAKNDTQIEEAVDAALAVLKKSALPVSSLLILTPYTLISLYIAISNMVEKVPSLKGGGAFWFTDLTTPDALYIFPIITSLSFMLTFELILFSLSMLPLCIVPIITSLFLMLNLELKYHFLRRLSTGRSHVMDGFVGVLYLLPMPLAATLPQAICCSLVAWSFASLAERIALKQPAVQKLLFGAPLKPTSSDGQKGPTAEDSPSPVKEHEEPVPPETRKSSDASVHRVKDESDKKSTKDG